ncbi:hypothetical protein [Thermomonas aquatica]|uniref:Glycosyltransferase n=1 Tax=Thermomonas aquatica TaxID=2202149 RepID=A0A5B7ZML3_9GAMM|nr:hypothetical protein [Thermomonas aquatica]QDA55859.1 hypothetical protein FHQ07_00250 [Thermomonas aquatica]
MTRVPAPVVVFAYNRPVHLQRTLDALAACRLADQTEVFAFADGPRNAAAATAIRQVREVLAQEATRGRFAGFHIDASEANRGLANSIIRGVGSVIERHGRAIVLEDDLLVTADFLVFMNDCLDYYAEDASVGAVTGFCPLESMPAGFRGDVFMAMRNASHSWGTWRRVWDGVDWSAAGKQRLDRKWAVRREFNREGNDRYDRLRRQMAGKIDSWSIRFGLSLFLRGLGTVYPAVNRVGNTGYDGSGVHCGSGTPMNERIAESDYTLRKVALDPAIQQAFHRTYSGPLRGRLLRDALARWPRLAGWLGR